MLNKFFFTLVSFSLLFGCKYREQENDVAALDKLKEKRDFYCQQEIDPYKYIDRCDGLTFLGLYDAYCKQIDIYAHEYTATYHLDSEPPYSENDIEKIKLGTGKWNRDIRPCWEFDQDGNGNGDSRSGISFESQLGAMIALYHRQDLDGLKRMLSYAKDHDWILGDGPEEYTKLNELSFLLKKMISVLEGESLAIHQEEEEGERYASLSEPEDKSVYEKLKERMGKLQGYRGKVIADYIAIKGEVYGYLNMYENELLGLCLEKDPENPIYNILWGKYHKDSQSYVDNGVEKLLNEAEYPADKLPGYIESIDWGDDLGVALYAWMIHILE